MRTDLDHVAIGTADVSEPLDFLVGQLGGTVMFGGRGVGFRPVQVRVGRGDPGMTVEVITPWRTEDNDFLARFVAGPGPGLHHLTFKVPDIHDAIAAVHDAGLEPIGIDTSNPYWRECFLHPRDAHGTVVQLAESHDGFDTADERLEFLAEHGPDGHLEQWWPDPPARAATISEILRVVLVTDDLGGARRLFVDLLGARVLAVGEPALDVVWPSGGRLRVEHTDGRPGLDRVEFVDRGGIGAVHVAGTRFVPLPARGRTGAPDGSRRSAAVERLG